VFLFWLWGLRNFSDWVGSNFPIFWWFFCISRIILVFIILFVWVFPEFALFLFWLWDLRNFSDWVGSKFPIFGWVLSVFSEFFWFSEFFLVGRFQNSGY
jgi:hypothetical protein